jgi:hypothetical protein
LSTDNDIPELLEDVRLLNEEAADLLSGLNDGRKPTEAFRLRARNLRKRLKTVGRTLERLIAVGEYGEEIAAEILKPRGIVH